MILNISYCKYNSYEPYLSFGAESDTFVIYLTNDDGTFTPVDFFYPNESTYNFAIPNDTNSYNISISSGNGVILDCVDSSGSSVNFPYDLNISPELFVKYFNVPAPEVDFDAKFSSLLTDITNLVNSSVSTLNGQFTSTNDTINTVGGSIQSQITGVSDSILNSVSAVYTKLDTVSTNVDGLVTSVSQLPTLLDGSSNVDFDFVSLNGASGSYKDGQAVTIDGLDGIFTVVSSQMMKNDLNVYLVVYKVTRDGQVGLFPSNMVHLSTGA